MLKNYFKMVFRNLTKTPVYSFINVAGLALGLAVCLIIGLFVQSELSYDRFHEDADRIYRVVQKEAGEKGLAWSGPQMGLKLEQDFPQIETAVRLIDGAYGYGSISLISYEDKSSGLVKRFYEDGFLYADPGFFNFFSFPLIQGAPGEVLSRPGTVVVTESVARKYFGNDNPIGKTLLLTNEYPLEITGVAADPPENSHIDYDFVTSYQSFYAMRGIPGEVDSFWWPPTHTYVKLHPEASASVLGKQLPSFSRRYRDADDASRMTALLQPLTEIWLGPNYRGQLQAGGSMTYIYLFSAIAVFILILACVNFMNLTTARVGNRIKEIGVRKAVGAGRRQLVLQFLAESMLHCLAALMLAFLLAELLLPFFNNIADKHILIPYGSGVFWLFMTGIVILTGLAAGSYPALYLSGFLPALAIKNVKNRWSQGAGLRKSLVVFQFTVSMVLLVGTAVVYRQLQYTHQARMGFDKERVVVIRGYGLEVNRTGQNALRYETFRSELLSLAGVMQVTAVNYQPGEFVGSISVWEAEGLPPEPNRQFPVQFVGEDFFEMLEADIVAGRPLRAGNLADIGTYRIRTNQDMQTAILENRAIVINETAARRLGWTPEEALGKQMRFYTTENDNIYQDYRGTVAGVVEDYHIASLREPIGPVAYMSARTPRGGYLSLASILVKLAPGFMQQAMQKLKQNWENVVPKTPFTASFLDQSLDNMYRKEIRLGKLITSFTLLAVLIACLGLFGLAAYTAEMRTKEIGIRKVLGASISQIIALLSFDFVKLVMIGFIIAAPIAWFVVNQWLQLFAYQVDIGWQVFVFAGAGALVLAILTVGWQSIRAALANPVDSLRSE